LVAVWAIPNATANVSAETNPGDPEEFVANCGRTVRPCPIIPPTVALTAISSAN
jgi:hypothetical protein